MFPIFDHAMEHYSIVLFFNVIGSEDVRKHSIIASTSLKKFYIYIEQGNIGSL